MKFNRLVLRTRLLEIKYLMGSQEKRRTGSIKQPRIVKILQLKIIKLIQFRGVIK